MHFISLKRHGALLVGSRGSTTSGLFTKESLLKTDNLQESHPQQNLTSRQSSPRRIKCPVLATDAVKHVAKTTRRPNQHMKRGSKPHSVMTTVVAGGVSHMVGEVAAEVEEVHVGRMT